MSDFDVPNECVYTQHDEWVRMADDLAIIGISDYAQDQLGDIIFVELPEVGSTVVANQPFGVIESVKAVSDLYAPISGEVAAVNERLAEAPESVNEDCYGQGWLISIAPGDGQEIQSLMSAEAYRKSIEERSD